MGELPDDPCDDWSSMPVPHQRSLEPDVYEHSTGLDTLRVRWPDGYDMHMAGWPWGRAR